MQDENAIAWAAGLFEGEGCLTPRGKTTAEAMLGMTDGDVVERFAAVIGFGNLTTERRKGTHKDLYRWSSSNATDVTRLLKAFLPYFGKRRRRLAEELLARMSECRGRHGERTHCPQGHPYTPENTYDYGNGRKCKMCHRAGVRRSKSRRLAAIK